MTARAGNDPPESADRGGGVGTDRPAPVGDEDECDPELRPEFDPPERPLVAVHGFSAAATDPKWRTLTRMLAATGYEAGDVWVLYQGRRPTTVRSPRTYARLVADRVAALHEETGRPVDVLAHSMGGLSTRWAVERLGADDHVAGLVTIGTPHRGTLVAGLAAVTPGGRAMVPGSPFLRALNGDGLAPSVEYTAVWSTDDELIRPRRRARLPGALFETHGAEGDVAPRRHVRASGVGHSGMVTHPEVFAAYRRYLG